MQISFWLFLGISLVASVFWGVHGCVEEGKSWKKGEKILASGIFLSEFIGSLAGWVCLYLLLIRNPDFRVASLDKVDLILSIGTVIGIAGYSYRIIDWIDTGLGKLKGQER